MSISRLEIINLRNLLHVETQPGAKYNLLFGQNGSGKTSFLEAIHYLGLARSFRTHLQHRLIHHEQQSFSVFGLLQQSGTTIPIGIERQRTGENRIRMNAENVTSMTELAKVLPIQFINADAHRLLLGGPKFRRQFMDWGVFHVEQTFLPLWQRAQQALRQRNAALRHNLSKEQIKLWDKELVDSAHELNRLRAQYIAQFEPLFLNTLKILLENADIAVTYQQGWPQDQGLAEMLEKSLERDRQLGYTQFGPQRADLVLRVNNVPAHDVLSQGQQKLVVYALRLAQGMLMHQQIGKNCIYLIDDLPAELDNERRQRVALILKELNTQVFITGIERESLQTLFPEEQTHLFHVEQGKIQGALSDRY